MATSDTSWVTALVQAQSLASSLEQPESVHVDHIPTKKSSRVRQEARYSVAQGVPLAFSSGVEFKIAAREKLLLLS